MLRAAIASSRAALAGGDRAEALHWLDRARRIAPQDHPLALEVAVLALSLADPLAEPIFAALAARFDLAEAWVGLATAAFNRGARTLAADALARLLSGHAWRPDWQVLADRLAPDGRWCALTGDGVPVGGRDDLHWRLDGATRPVGPRLPPGWRQARRLAATSQGGEVLGSPIRIDRLVRLEGVIRRTDAGLDGWLWHPADPDRTPVLHVPGTPELRLRPRERLAAPPSDAPFLRPFRLSVPALALAHATAPPQLLGPDDRPPRPPRRPRRAAARLPDGPAVLLITHDAGGGTAHSVAARRAALIGQGNRPLMLTPGAAGCRLDGRFYRLPQALPALHRALRAAKLAWIEQHHLHGHHAAIADLAARLGVTLHLWVHDYAVICPRTSLAKADGRYCGEPPPAACAACLAEAGDPPADVARLRARSARDLAAAAEVIAPSADTAARLRRHFPALRPRIRPHDAVAPPTLPAAVRPGARRVGLVGAIDRRKGFDILLACAQDAAARDLPLDFALVGFSIDDAALLATGRVRISGLYEEPECQALLARARPDIGFVPSLWPETWCFALSHLWQAGLPTLVFDLGAQAERVRAERVRGAGGRVLPLALPPGRINDALMG